MADYWILDDQLNPAPAPSLEAWGEWLEAGGRRVAKTMVETAAGEVCVSTVFLGSDASIGKGPPRFFETMIFGGEYDGYQAQCSTWDEAIDMHRMACARVRRYRESPAAR